MEAANKKAAPSKGRLLLVADVKIKLARQKTSSRRAGIFLRFPIPLQTIFNPFAPYSIGMLTNKLFL